MTKNRAGMFSCGRDQSGSGRRIRCDVVVIAGGRTGKPEKHPPPGDSDRQGCATPGVKVQKIPQGILIFSGSGQGIRVKPP